MHLNISEGIYIIVSDYNYGLVKKNELFSFAGQLVSKWYIKFDDGAGIQDLFLSTSRT